MKFSELDYGDRFQVWDSKYDYVNGGTYMKICPATIINKTSGIYPPLPQEERIVAVRRDGVLFNSECINDEVTIKPLTCNF